MDRYPITLHRSVLLIDGKIVNWKTGTKQWDTVNAAMCSKQPIHRILEAYDKGSEITVATMSGVVDNTEENEKFFEEAADWYRQWPLCEGYSLFLPYTEADNAQTEMGV